MKHRTNLRSTARSSRVRRWFPAAVLIFVVGMTGASAHAQNPPATAFTYQGQLKDSGQPAAGLHDFRFRLFDAAEGGTQVGPLLCADDVDVAGGVFTVILDFGGQFATTAERHLDIDVRRDTGLNCDNPAGFVLLAPRQQITATPTASHAAAAFALDAADGSPQNAVFVDENGNVGIGTTTPTTALQIKGSEEAISMDGPEVGAPNLSFVSFRDSTGARIGYVGDGSTGDLNAFLTSDAGDVVLNTAAGRVLNATADGKVGIGTTTPRATLHVHGQSQWLTGGNGGGLPREAGGGLRLYYDGARGNIFAFDYAAGTPRNLILQEPGGNVGIGTTGPLAKLDVRGDIRLGNSGQFFAPGGQENLRVVRGNIDGNGSVTAGTGFTSRRTGEGNYTVTFVPPFSGVPTVTLQAYRPSIGIFRIAHLLEPTASTLTIRIKQEGEGAQTDSDFGLVAIGPR